MLEFSLDHLCSYHVELADSEFIGPVPEGLKINFYIVGGRVEGPKLNGILLPVGGDWLTIRTDGVGILDVRATMKTDDGAKISLDYTGLVDFGEDAYELFLKGERPPVVTRLRTAPRMLTAHPSYLWVNRIQCLGIGTSIPKETGPGISGVKFDLYEVQ